MTRGQIAGWTICIGAYLAYAGYYYYEAHTPAFIAKAKVQNAQAGRVVGQILAQVGCADNIEARDDGTTPAETVAKAIIAKCGPFMSVALQPIGCSDTKCMQAMQRISLQVEIEDVLEMRFKRAQARADDAKAALEGAQPH